jgi:hypothetical protein
MLVNFTTIWPILLSFRFLCPFGIFGVHFGTFFPFWYVVPRKTWQPCSAHTQAENANLRKLGTKILQRFGENNFGENNFGENNFGDKNAKFYFSHRTNLHEVHGE